MADMGTSDVAVTVQPTVVFPHNPWIEGEHRYAQCSLSFGDGALTYPTTGVPMPGFTKFGLSRNMELLTIVDQAGTPYTLKYDRVNNSIRMYDPGGELAGATDAPAAQTAVVVARGW